MSRPRDHASTAGHLVLDPLVAGFSRRALIARSMRLRARAWLILQAATGATLAWYVAHDVVGHPVPFFAPITAMVCLGLTYEDRLRRIVELTIGVAIGVAIGDLFVHSFGTGLWQILAVCTVAMSLAVLAGAGQLLMMQAGIQGVIVTTLVAGEGEALSRWLDAAIGGCVALVIAVLAPMRSTTRRPREHVVELVGHLAAMLTDTAQSLRNRDAERATRALGTARGLSTEMEALRASTVEAVAAARVAPLLSRGHRAQLREIQTLLPSLDLAIRNVRVLARRAEAAVSADEFVPDSYIDMVEALAEASATIQQHLADQTPLGGAQEDLVHLARQSTWGHSKAQLSAEVLRAQVRSTVVDLLVLSGMTLAQARQRVPPTKEEMDPES